MQKTMPTWVSEIIPIPQAMTEIAVKKPVRKTPNPIICATRRGSLYAVSSKLDIKDRFCFIPTRYAKAKHGIDSNNNNERN
ncbi:hypothetical protein [Agaribacter marinus]|uniref:Uncharacterized protein n=1 Tax=Agaribacter marinus TaxID=1431249 RepID=A0AA37SVF4_9ALTE|nr:hypothetical protein [Agaribacter marinus]GLR69389.1 hypothetical protein GCM10007852_02970 [Agaribacter marinus]